LELERAPQTKPVAATAGTVAAMAGTVAAAAGTVALAVLVFTLKLSVWTLRAFWAVLAWAGRVTLWIVFWPLAMAKARKRHSRQQTDRIVAAIEKSNRK
jgi:hypothetical protein